MDTGNLYFTNVVIVAQVHDFVFVARNESLPATGRRRRRTGDEDQVEQKAGQTQQGQQRKKVVFLLAAVASASAVTSAAAVAVAIVSVAIEVVAIVAVAVVAVTVVATTVVVVYVAFSVGIARAVVRALPRSFGPGGAGRGLSRFASQDGHQRRDVHQHPLQLHFRFKFFVRRRLIFHTVGGALYFRLVVGLCRVHCSTVVARVRDDGQCTN